MPVDQTFVDECWRDLRTVKVVSHNDYLVNKFRGYCPEQKEVAEYISKLYASEAAAGRANAAERAWRWGTVVGFALVAIGFYLQDFSNWLVAVNLLAAAATLSTPLWKR